MTVSSLQTTLNDFAVNYLSVVVPEDVEVVVSVTIGMSPDVCEDGQLHGFMSRCRVNLWTCFPPPTPLGKEIKAQASYGIESWMVEDGDTDPLQSVLESLWEQCQFLALMKPVMADLQNTYAEVGPFREPEPEYEDEDAEDE